jgi:hypothetical protein
MYCIDNQGRIAIYLFQRLSFPSSESSNGQAGFNFSLSSTADTEGPQGSFECIQQKVSKYVLYLK